MVGGVVGGDRVVSGVEGGRVVGGVVGAGVEEEEIE